MASQLDLAARLPGEADLLAAVVAQPADDTPKLVYADWLDEHNDPRGAFLRQYVTASQKGQPLPDSRKHSDGWLEIIGYRLAALLQSLGPGDVRASILARAKPAVAIFATRSDEDGLSPGVSKFGGIPGLPAGSEWPRCDEAPLEFLAQFDLAELQRTVAGRVLPSSGLLSFFMYHNYPQDAYGDDDYRGVPGGLKIIHTPSGADIRALQPPGDLTEDIGAPKQPCELTLVDALDLPDGDPDRPVVDGSIQPTLADEAPHQLFGYSHITVLAEDPTPGPDWEQLLRFSSDNRLNWGWGDGHRLFWYIRTDDLRKHRFDRTTAIDG